LYFRIFWAYILIIFLTPEIATFINTYVLFSLSRIMSGLFFEILLLLLGLNLAQINTQANNRQPIPAAVRSRELVCGRSLAGVAGSKPTGGVGGYLL
jgi:hypothetical protein